MSLQNEIQLLYSELTNVERKISTVLLLDYPFGGLVPIQELAQRASVSAPSIMRFVGKLGCNGYLEFQRRLIDELKEGSRSPIDLRSTQDFDSVDDYLKGYGERLCSRIRDAVTAVSKEEFETICNLLSDPKRTVFLLGGRVSDMLARGLSIHLRMLRANVIHIDSNPELWPDYLQQMKSRDVLVLFDFRRYQVTLEKFATLSAEAAKPRIILFTDKWLSPIAKLSTHVVPLPIDVGTAWDTLTTALAVIEAMIVKIAENDWSHAQSRMEKWDRLRPFPPKPNDH